MADCPAGEDCPTLAAPASIVYHPDGIAQIRVNDAVDPVALAGSLREVADLIESGGHAVGCTDPACTATHEDTAGG